MLSLLSLFCFKDRLEGGYNAIKYFPCFRFQVGQRTVLEKQILRFASTILLIECIFAVVSLSRKILRLV